MRAWYEYIRIYVAALRLTRFLFPLPVCSFEFPSFFLSRLTSPCLLLDPRRIMCLRSYTYTNIDSATWYLRLSKLHARRRRDSRFEPKINSHLASRIFCRLNRNREIWIRGIRIFYLCITVNIVRDIWCEFILRIYDDVNVDTRSLPRLCCIFNFVN